MSGLLDRPLVSPTLIGREVHLASITRTLEQVRDGQGQVLLVKGEAGIGKSRLVTETKARAAGLGWAILQGTCYEPDRSLPYAPILDLLRNCFSGCARDEIAAQAEAVAPEMLRLLPELAAAAPERVPPPAIDPDQERRRLFSAFAHFLLDRAVTQPALVVIEDLHWCDDISLAFLPDLARRIAARQLALLLTYRGEEVGPALRHLLATLDRGRLATELVLSPLALADSSALVRAILALPHPPHAAFVAGLHALTEGNPFFIEEALRSLVADGGITYAAGRWNRKILGELRIPRSVDDAVRRRVAQLAPDTTTLLQIVAVVGRRFDLPLLRDLTGRDDGDLLDKIKALIAAQLVVEESVDGFAFRHALTRQAVYGQLLTRERSLLHRQIATSIERLDAPALEARVGDLAYHYHAAGVWDKALAYCRRAGERALALYAPWAAVEHFTHALEAAEHLSDSPTATLHRDRGRAHATLGDFAAALSDHEIALRLVQEGDDGVSESQALLDLGSLWASHDYARTGAYFRQALDLARARADRSALAQSLNRLGNWYVNNEQPRAAMRYHDEALALFEVLHDRHGHAETLDLRGLARQQAGDQIGALQDYRQAVALFRELDDRQGQASVLTLLGLTGGSYETETIPPGSLGREEAIGALDAALEIVRAIGARGAEAYALGSLAIALGPRGEYRRAFTAIQGGLAIAEEIEHHQWRCGMLCTAGALHLDLLDLRPALEYLERARTLAQSLDSRIFIHLVTALLARARLAAGEAGAARALLDAVLPPGESAVTVGQRLCECARAEIALASGEATAALRIADQLLATAPHIDAFGEHGVPRLALIRGAALRMLGNTVEAEAALLNARDGASAQGMPSLLWRAEAALGTLYRTQRRRKDAAGANARARTLIEDLGSDVPDERARAAFLRGALALLPSPSLPSPRQTARVAFGGLTEREREVATLVARGLSNQEIAAALTLTKRTVETHISNIFSKLGVTSRVRVAAWSVEHGLPRERAETPAR